MEPLVVTKECKPNFYLLFMITNDYLSEYFYKEDMIIFMVIYFF